MRLSSGPGRENGYPASSASEQPKNEDRARYVILDCRLARRGFDFAYAVRAFLDPDRITGRDRPTGGSFWNMSRTRIRIDPGNPRSLPAGRVDYGVLDGTTERDIALQQREDDDEAARDMARYARRVRKRLGLTQLEFARRIDVSQETIRNWEQGKTLPDRRCQGLAQGSRQGSREALRVLG